MGTVAYNEHWAKGRVGGFWVRIEFFACTRGFAILGRSCPLTLDELM